MKRKRDNTNTNDGFGIDLYHLPGYDLPTSYGVVTTLGSVSLLVANTLLEIHSKTIAALGASITIPGVYLLTAKGLYYKQKFEDMSAWQVVKFIGKEFWDKELKSWLHPNKKWLFRFL